MLKPVGLLTEYKVDPLGMDEPWPRFGYRLEGDGKRQSSYRLEVRDEAGETVFDSGVVKSAATVQLEYAGRPLRPFQRYRWTVEATDESGQSARSAEAFFETGFMGTPWRAQWIAAFTGSANQQPVRCLGKAFAAAKKVKSARLAISALGLHLAYLNGKAVSEDCLTPGWTDYYDRVQYQVYDVAGLLKKGDNMLAVELAEGWYAGRISRVWNHERPTFGEHPMLIAELRITYADGGTEVVATGPDWKADLTEIRYSDIYMGEKFCADLADPAIYLREGRIPVTVCQPKARIEWQSGAPVRRVMTLKPVSIDRRANGAIVVDFGQNLAGRERLRIPKAGRGAVVTVRHGEMLNPDGSLYVENLRSAAASTVYVTGDKADVYEPKFTFYGFRYLEISGWPGKFDERSVEAVVLSSELAVTGDFKCSNPLLNQLYSNIVWGQRGNFVDVPTDCPQRDERLGWTGDTQVFVNVATFNMFCAEFYTKWIEDLNLSRHGDVYPNFAPMPYRQPRQQMATEMNFASGWGDAGLICPHEMYRKYGDCRILRKYLGNMARHLDFQIERAGGSRIVRNACYGDWLNIDAPTDESLISTAYLAGMNFLLAEMAELCGEKEFARQRRRIGEEVREAYQQEFFTPSGELKVKTQTAALLSLHFDLVPKKALRKTADFLLHDIRVTRKLHLSTGFLGTPLLMKVLTKLGEIDTAYELLQQTTYPGWLYPVTQGATTMWERWNSWTREKGFGDVGMNSFNHYAYGAVGEWFFETICGIQSRDGFATLELAPQFGRSLQFAEAGYDSIRGRIVSGWRRRKDGAVVWKFTIPPNVEAKIVIPAGWQASGPAAAKLGAGSYQFILNPKEC